MNKLCYVAWGDSLTYGYGLEEKDKWPYIVSKALGVTVHNMGISGITSVEAYKNIDGILDLNPDLVFVHFGMNDSVKNNSIENITLVSDFVDVILRMVNELRGHGSRVILMTPHQIIEGNEERYFFCRHPKEIYGPLSPNEEIMKYVDALTKISNHEGIPCINLYEEFAMQDLSTVLQTQNNDGVHYSPKGSLVVANKILEIIKENKI